MKESIDNQNINTISELRQLNEELENYFQSTITPQFFFDRDLILRKYSPAAMAKFNISTLDIGKPLNLLSNNLQYTTIKDDIENMISSHKVIEKEIQTNDNKWYRMNITPHIQRKENKVTGVIVTFIDINNYVLSLKELQKINNEHEIFIYSVSHDLKAPLSNIDGLIDMLKESIDKNEIEERERILGLLKSSASNMKEMIAELSAISHVQTESADNKIKIKFRELLDEVCLTIKEQIDESHAKIETDFRIEEISFSRKNLRSILYNLLSNAIKYRSNEREPVVAFRTQETDGFITLSVKDNGRGIEEGKKGEIFLQFNRVLKNVEGTGIGLFLVAKIVNSQGGKIIVNSKVNEGSEFLLYLKSA